MRQMYQKEQTAVTQLIRRSFQKVIRQSKKITYKQPEVVRNNTMIITKHFNNSLLPDLKVKISIKFIPVTCNSLDISRQRIEKK